MPIEVALLPMVESAYDPNAVSTRARRGCGSSCRRRGRVGLKQNFWFDSRRNVIAAHRQRAQLPARSCTAISAIGSSRSRATTGAKATSRAATASNRKAGKPADYAYLKIPDETRNYLPKLQAVKNIIARPRKVRDRLHRHPGRAVFRGDQDGPQDRRQGGDPARRDVRSTSPVSQPAAQPSGHRRRRRLHDPAADRQSRALCGEAAAHEPAARVVAGL